MIVSFSDPGFFDVLRCIPSSVDERRVQTKEVSIHRGKVPIDVVGSKSTCYLFSGVKGFLDYSVRSTKLGPMSHRLLSRVCYEYE